MDFKQFLETTSPETLEKLAEEAQNELVAKVADALLPLMEKQAEYTVALLLEKIAGAPVPAPDGTQDDINPTNEAQVVQEATGTSTPAAGNKDNSAMGTHTRSEDLLAPEELKAAINEAVEAGQADKIVPFVKALMQAHPDVVDEIVKIIKVELHAALMNKKIDQETAVAVSQQVDQLIGA